MMAKKHVWRIKKEYFRQLKSGEKKLEVRVGYSAIKKVKEGDSISFENYGKNSFCVERISVYDSFSRMLEIEQVNDVLPGMTKQGALKVLKDIYPSVKEKLGIYVFELTNKEKDNNESKFAYQVLSDLRKIDSKEFSRLIYECYAITDWISEDYPNHLEHFYQKYVPGIFSGEREIIACKYNGKVVGVVVLKKDNFERKISTLYVRPDCQDKGVASKLLEMSFNWLGTDKPLITIADYKLNQFAKIIEKYNWIETNILSVGYYNDHSKEHVFNG